MRSQGVSARVRECQTRPGYDTAVSQSVSECQGVSGSVYLKVSIRVCLPDCADRGGGKEKRLRHRPVKTQLLGETALGTVVCDLLAAH
jgi:hypothetical protein